MENSVTRYSDKDLAEFKELIEKKLAKTIEQLNQLESQLNEINENSNSSFDLDDDSRTSFDKEFLDKMANRQKRYLRDLENALLRIKNKTYGICQISNTLIDKKRLMAVPTTTKNIVEKLQEGKPKAVEPIKRKTVSTPLKTIKVKKSQVKEDLSELDEDSDDFDKLLEAADIEEINDEHSLEDNDDI